MDSRQFCRHFGPVVDFHLVRPPGADRWGPPHGVMVKAFNGWTRVLVLVTNKPPPGYDQVNTIEGSWIASYLETRGGTLGQIEFDPRYDVGKIDLDPSVAYDPVLDYDGWTRLKNHPPASLARRILRAALPTILDITQAPDDEDGHHPYFDLPSELDSRTACEYFVDTLRLQLVTLHGRLEVIQGHYLAPRDSGPISPAELRGLGFHDFEDIPSFKASDVRFTKPYTMDYPGNWRSGWWFNVDAPGLDNAGAICVMAQPGDDPFHFRSSLRVLASIRAANLNSEARIVPLRGKQTLTPSFPTNIYLYINRRFLLLTIDHRLCHVQGFCHWLPA